MAKKVTYYVTYLVRNSRAPELGIRIHDASETGVRSLLQDAPLWSAWYRENRIDFSFFIDPAFTTIYERELHITFIEYGKETRVTFREGSRLMQIKLKLTSVAEARNTFLANLLYFLDPA